jgi:hypothetical protein
MIGLNFNREKSKGLSYGRTVFLWIVVTSTQLLVAGVWTMGLAAGGK